MKAKEGNKLCPGIDGPGTEVSLRSKRQSWQRLGLSNFGIYLTGSYSSVIFYYEQITSKNTVTIKVWHLLNFPHMKELIGLWVPLLSVPSSFSTYPHQIKQYHLFSIKFQGYHKNHECSWLKEHQNNECLPIWQIALKKYTSYLWGYIFLCGLWFIQELSGSEQVLEWPAHIRIYSQEGKICFL